VRAHDALVEAPAIASDIRKEKKSESKSEVDRICSVTFESGTWCVG
jgi:hypothetical protein